MNTTLPNTPFGKLGKLGKLGNLPCPLPRFAGQGGRRLHREAFRLGHVLVHHVPSVALPSFRDKDETMYLPPLFREDRLEVQHDVIRHHPLGLLITAGPGGLQANAIPFLVKPELSEYGTLQAHLARANGQWRELADVDECLVVFQGPDAYVTPSWYATKQESGKVVPTWNYVAVHAWGRPRVIEDASWLREQIGALTDSQEDAFAQPWAVSDAPEAFIAGQMKGIIGLEIPIARIEGKWKVSQNRSEADRVGVIAGFAALGEEGREMRELVAERVGRS